MGKVTPEQQAAAIFEAGELVVAMLEKDRADAERAGFVLVMSVEIMHLHSPPKLRGWLEEGVRALLSRMYAAKPYEPVLREAEARHLELGGRGAGDGAGRGLNVQHPGTEARDGAAGGHAESGASGLVVDDQGDGPRDEGDKVAG